MVFFFAHHPVNLTFIKETLEPCETVTVCSAGFHDREGQQYCQQCFLTLFASRCQGCSQPILENYISALNSLWHPQCFVCRVSVSLWLWVTLWSFLVNKSPVYIQCVSLKQHRGCISFLVKHLQSRFFWNILKPVLFTFMFTCQPSSSLPLFAAFLGVLPPRHLHAPLN